MGLRFTVRLLGRLLLYTGILALFSAQVGAWGSRNHLAITRAAFEALPAWQQELWAGQREPLINRYCLIPDIAGLSENRAELGRYIVLPNGDRFTHSPQNRHHNAYLMKHYFDKAVDHVKARQMDESARYAGTLLHFLEDSGSPAHSIPDDNQLEIVKDLMPMPERFRDAALHRLVEAGEVRLNLEAYRPQLLGTSSAEAVFNLIERLNAMVRNARAQVIPIVQGLVTGNDSEVETGRRRAAIMDAQVASDALYTLVSIATERFERQETSNLDIRDVSSLTPLEVVKQSYFSQFGWFSDPYFGVPVRNALLENGEVRRPLALKLCPDCKVTEFARGIGLGTHSRLTYALPEKVYDRFECLVGLHPTLGQKGKVVFRFYADGAAVFYSGLMTGEDPAQKVNLPMWDVNEISISVETANNERGHNYAVIAQPTLFKSKKTPGGRK